MEFKKIDIKDRMKENIGGKCLKKKGLEPV